MLRNLIAEMARERLTNEDMAKLLKVTRKTVDNKIKEETEFTRKEMFLIQSIFPKCRFDYLFESSEDKQQANYTDTPPASGE